MKPSINTIDSNQKPVVESLEPRVLYSADAALLVSGFVLVDDDQGAGVTPQIRLVDDSSEPTAVASSEGEVQPVEIVFVDSNVSDSERLQRIIEDQSYGRNTVIYSLAPNDDGVDRIAEILQQHDQVSAVHILTEGSAAGITLGDVQLNGGSLDSIEESLKSWRSGLSEDADILFYGSDYAVTEAGRNILNAISSLTGADVAASSDFGAADLGSNWATVSDWNPEHQLGDIESLPLLSDDAVENWRTIQHSITVDTDQDVVDVDADLSSISALELNPGADGLVSLREAVLAANADVGLDEIVLDPGTYVISGGEMNITEAVIIRGESAANTTLDAGGSSRFFNVNIPTAGTFTVEDITLANAHSASDGGAMIVSSASVEITNAILTGNRSDNLGGAIFTSSTVVLNVTDSLLEDNQAVKDGGAIYAEGTLSIAGSEFIDNWADKGGAIFTKSGAPMLVVQESRFFNNYASSDGGAMYLESTVTVSDSLFESNRADNDSGAIQVSENGTITGSTFYQNTSGNHGGAIEVSGGSTELDVESSTFVGNSADSKGGAIRRTGGPTVEVSNSLFAANHVLGTPDNFEGQVLSLGFNLVESTPVGGHYTPAVSDLIGIDPQVGALSDNGGRWHTVALNSNSPAINAGGGSATDATGLGRNEIPDIGAFEYRGTAPVAKIYWTDQNNNTIHRANLDGTLSQEIYRSSGSNYVYDLEVDEVNGYLYWIESSTQHPDHDGAGYIMRADLSGMNAAQFEPASGDRDMPMGLALDPDGGTEGYLYYITNVTAATFELGDADYVWRYDLSDGTRSLVDWKLQRDYTDIEYDNISNKLFVTDYNGEHDARGVMIFDLSDGNALTQIDLDPGEGPLSIAVVPGGEEAYLVSADGIVKWTEAGGVEAAVPVTTGTYLSGIEYYDSNLYVTDVDGRIFKMPLDLSSSTDILTGLGDPYRAAVFLPTEVTSGPSLDVLNTITVDEGSQVTLTTAMLSASDPNTPISEIVFIVQSQTPGGGGFFDENDVAVTQFTQEDIELGNIYFEHDGSETGSYAVVLDVTDGIDTVAANTATITVTSVNDAPTGTSSTLTLDEDETHDFAVGDFGFSDPEEGHAFESVMIVNIPLSGALVYNSAPVVNGQVIPVSNLVSLKYTPSANASGAGHATITFRVMDDGGTANGGVNTDETVRTLTIDVDPVNDAPTGTSSTLTLDEDETHSFVVGDFGYADAVEGDAFESVMIVNIPTSGSLMYNSAPVVNGQVIPVSNLASLQYTPVANASGAAHATITFRVMDDGGTANGGVNTDETVRTLTIDVDAVNDAPTGTSSTLTLDEDETHSFVVGDFGFADPVEGHAFESVMIVNIPTNGALLYNSAPVVNGQVIPVSNLASLQYTPVANASGAAHATITFRVMDDGGTANGGVNTDETVRTLTIDVDAVNDAPTGTSSILTLDEDETHSFVVGDFGYADAVEGDTFESVMIVNIPTSGALMYNSAPVVNGQVIPVSNLASLQYTPVANASGAAHATITFRVMDDGGTANSGVNTDETVRTLTIDVDAVNDAPTGTSSILTLDEDETHSFVVGDFGYADAVEGDTFESVMIVNIPTSGSLMYNSAPVVNGQVIPVSNLASLQYTPVANASGAAHATITFRVMDDGGTANGGVNTDETVRTLTIDVDAVNDAPTGTSSILTLDEDETHSFVVGDFGFADPVEGHAFESVMIVNIPTNGALMYNSAPVVNGQVIPVSNLASLQYTPVANASGAAHATITFRVMDDGGTANGGVNTDETVRTLTIDVDAVNDAPTGTSSILTLDEDETHSFVVGDFGYADAVEGDTFESVMIVNIPTSGALMYNSAPVVNGQVIPVSNLASLQYTPVANASGAAHATITFRVMDDGGTANGGVNTDETVRTLTIDVDAVNDAPTGTSSILTLDEDETHSFVVGDFGYADAVEGDTFESVMIVNIPTSGALMYNSAPVVNGQVIPVSNLASLQYTPVANASGAAHATITFRVMDDGGTANGGVNTDETVHTLTIDVDPVNDAPTGTSSTLTLDEDETHSFVVGDFGFADPVEGHAFESVMIVNIPTNGSLMYNSAPVVNGQVIPVSNLASLQYTPVANASGAAHATITFRVMDDGGTANGGVNTDETVRTLTIDVDSVNDAPSGQSSTIVVPEAREHRFSVADFGFSDSADGDELKAIRIMLVPGAGSLLLGTDVVVNAQVILAADIPNLVFRPALNAYGVGYATLDFRVMDSGGTANGGIDTDPITHTLTFDVLDPVHAPVIADASLGVMVEDTATPPAATFTSLFGSGFSDADTGQSFAAVAVVGNLATSDEGVWQFSIDGVNWMAMGDVTSSNALVLDTLTQVRFSPAVNFNGSPAALQVKALDSYYSGVITAPGDLQYIDTAVFGTDGPVSIDAALLSVQVTPVNDAPVLSADVVMPEITEDAELNSGVLVADLFQPVFSDSLDQLDAELQGVAISANLAASTEGRWQYLSNGSWLDIDAVSGTESLVLSADSQIRFTPTENYHGIPGELQVHALDQSYTGSYSTPEARVILDTTVLADTSAYSHAPVTLAIAVTPVPDAPENLSLSATQVDENTAGAVVGSVTYNDVDESPFPVLSVDDPRFIIDNGLLRLAEGVSLDFEQESAITLNLELVDGDGFQIQRQVQLEVRDLNDVPQLGAAETSLSVVAANVIGIPDNLFVDQDGDSLTYSVGPAGSEPLPAWLTFDTGLQAFLIESLPDKATIVEVEVTAEDPSGATETSVVVLQIAARPVEVTEAPVASQALASLAVESEKVTPTQVEESAVEVPVPDTSASEAEPEPEPVMVAVQVQEPIVRFEAAEQEVFSRSTNRSEVSEQNDLLMERLQDVDAQSLDQLFTLSDNEVLESFANLSQLMDEQYAQNSEEARFAQRVVGTTTAITSGFSVGYILWLIRGGTLIGSVLSALPAWRFIDPLPVLDSMGDDDESGDSESLQSMVAEQKPAHPAEAPDQAAATNASRSQPPAKD